MDQVLFMNKLCIEGLARSFQAKAVGDMYSSVLTAGRGAVRLGRACGSLGTTARMHPTDQTGLTD
jgi:hypothetical protein